MVADPDGLFEAWADDWSLVENYRFGTGTCDFLICRRCGVFIAAVSETAADAIGGAISATIKTFPFR